MDRGEPMTNKPNTTREEVERIRGACLRLMHRVVQREDVSVLRIPADPDHDADLIARDAAVMLGSLAAENDALRASLQSIAVGDDDTQQDGGPAFPCTVWGPRGFKLGESMGMTLRDWFAGQALAGVCANHAWGDNFSTSDAEHNARAAYVCADAMIKARAAAGGQR
jgi:hypothetical protein